MTRTALAILVVALAAGCTPTPNEESPPSEDSALLDADGLPEIAPADPSLGHELPCGEHPFVEGASGLREMDKVVLDDGRIEVYIIEVEDSRCPDGVVCVWEGVAEVRVGVRVGIYAEAHTISTHHPDLVVGHRLIRLEDVSRASELQGRISPAEVTLGLYAGANNAACHDHTI